MARGAMPLPEGTSIVLDRSTRCYDGGRVVAGLRTGRVLTLSPAGAEVMATLRRAEGAATAAALTLGRRLVDAGLAHPRPPATGRPADVTVVVPVRDRTASLAALLATLGGEHPVLVVDDGSADASGIAAVCREHGARVVHRATNGGPAAARNTGLEYATSELVAFIDSDCRPPRNWVERLSPHFEDPVVGAVAPRITPSRTGRTVLGRYTAVRSALDLGADEAAVAPGGVVGYVPTAALVVRRAAIGRGFDPGLRVGEDVDAIWRLHDAGWTVRYDPAVTVAHQEPSSWSALLRRRARYGTSAAPLAARHPDRLAPAVLHLWPTAATVAALVGSPAVAVSCAAAGVVRSATLARGAGIPTPTAARWAARGVWASTLALGRTATTFASPVLAACAWRHPRTRPAVAVLVAVPPLAEWFERRPALDPVRFTSAAVADDVAYGIGVWAGCLRARSAKALWPKRSSRAGCRPRRATEHGCRAADVSAPMRPRDA